MEWERGKEKLTNKNFYPHLPKVIFNLIQKSWDKNFWKWSVNFKRTIWWWKRLEEMAIVCLELYLTNFMESKLFMGKLGNFVWNIFYRKSNFSRILWYKMCNNMLIENQRMVFGVMTFKLKLFHKFMLVPLKFMQWE